MVGDGMAYIDRDMAISRINSIRPVNPNKSDYTHGIDVGIAMAKVAINEQPTADVVDKERYDRLLENATIISEALKKYQTADAVERKHGEWILKDGSKFLWVCSECGAVIYSEHNDDRERFHAFCGACGADMREEGGAK